MISTMLAAALALPADTLPGWQLVDSTDSEHWYVAAAIIRDGDIASTNVLVNYSAPRKSGANAFRSVATAVEFNCKKKKYRITTQLTYADPNGQGALAPVESFDRNWWPLGKGEAMQKAGLAACRKSG
jgi:hypothetical protein